MGTGRNMRAIVGIVALLLLVAGCGGDNDPAEADPPESPPSSTTDAPAPEPTSPPEEPTTPAVDGDALRESVTAYSDAFLTGDAETAYELLSQRCQDRTSLEEFAGIVDQAAGAYGEALPLTSYEEEVSGDLARVSYGYDASELDQDAEPWARESGEWRQDDC